MEFVKQFCIELLRVAILAALPVIIVSLQASQVDLKVLGVSVAVAVLRAVDRALHETVAEKGIVRF